MNQTTPGTEAGFDLDLDNLEEIAREATPGPWRAKQNDVFAGPRFRICQDVTAGGSAKGMLDERKWQLANAAFIAAANPAAILALIALARQAAPDSAVQPVGDATRYPLSEYQPGQWWLRSIKALRDTRHVDDDTVRAASVVLNFAATVFDQCRAAQPVQAGEAETEQAWEAFKTIYGQDVRRHPNDDWRGFRRGWQARASLAPVSAQQGAAEQQAEFPHDFRKWDLKREDYVPPPFAAPASQHDDCDAAFDKWYAAQGHWLTNERACRLIWQAAYEQSRTAGAAKGGNTNPPLAYIPPHVMESLRNGCRVGTVLEPKPENGCTEALYG